MAKKQEILDIIDPSKFFMGHNELDMAVETLVQKIIPESFDKDRIINKIDDLATESMQEIENIGKSIQEKYEEMKYLSELEFIEIIFRSTLEKDIAKSTDEMLDNLGSIQLIGETMVYYGYDPKYVYNHMIISMLNCWDRSYMYKMGTGG